MQQGRAQSILRKESMARTRLVSGGRGSRSREPPMERLPSARPGEKRVPACHKGQYLAQRLSKVSLCSTPVKWLCQAWGYGAYCAPEGGQSCSEAGTEEVLGPLRAN